MKKKKKNEKENEKEKEKEKENKNNQNVKSNQITEMEILLPCSIKLSNLEGIESTEIYYEILVIQTIYSLLKNLQIHIFLKNYNWKQDFKIKKNETKILRKQLDYMKTFTIKQINEKLKAENEAISLSPEEKRRINFLIEMNFEKICFPPFLQNIMKSIISKTQKEDLKVNQNKEKLKTKTMEFYGIANNLRDLDWSLPIKSLQRFTNCAYPFEFLNVIINSALGIYQTIERQLPNQQECIPQQLISGDDFLSIFIFSLVQSNFQKLKAVENFILSYCDPVEFSSESGYYLTTFCSAVQFIEKFNEEK
ncbi:hypothetical protein M0811_05054 [Anaeramoeba ignava]|uniref:VPS9 domain-containing protein n=1 Tax=Anaeramoeba ignava TaxID=1746090 RepID=A0A9Q0REX6_ANAIG|nr:hypothetical protein M0811_05054 [Anaeramoeba ignava]